MASPLADYVVSLGMDGRVASRGSALEAVAEYKTLSPELVENILDEEKKVDQEGPDATAKQTDGKLIVAEEIAEGHVSWDACNCHLPSGFTPETHPVCKVKLFFNGLGGSHVSLFWICFIGGLLLCESFMVGQTWTMGYWAEQYVLHPAESVNVTLYVNAPVFPLLTSHFFGSYLSVYGLLLLAGAIAYVIGSTVYIFGTLRASRSIHGRLIEAVLGTTLRSVPRCPYGV